MCCGIVGLRLPKTATINKFKGWIWWWSRSETWFRTRLRLDREIAEHCMRWFFCASCNKHINNIYMGVFKTTPWNVCAFWPNFPGCSDKRWATWHFSYISFVPSSLVPFADIGFCTWHCILEICPFEKDKRCTWYDCDRDNVYSNFQRVTYGNYFTIFGGLSYPINASLSDCSVLFRPSSSMVL